ncbi:MAG TPA: DUF2269 domain-containing protein [Symbiobacteriaceae bacterium]|nr:DUF2269 domain-containing protein [Symbiobacteriaceae bacterium]
MMIDIASLLGTGTVILLLLLLLMRLARPLPKLTVMQKKWWLIFHIAGVVIYFTGVLGSLALVLLGRGDLAGPAHQFVQYFDWFVIIPGAFISLLTGFWIALRTSWGLTRFWWVIAKWAGNIAAILYGSTLMRRWIHEGGTAPAGRQLLLLGTVISLSILVLLMVISYLKPWGQRRPPALD